MNTPLLYPEIHTEYRELASGLLVPKTHRDKPIGFDFFAGAGGFSLGFIQAGFEMLGACEWSPEATHTYLTNLGAHPVQMYYTSNHHKKRITDYFQKHHEAWLKNHKNDPTATYLVSGHGWRQSEALTGQFYPGVKNFFFGDVCELDGKGKVTPTDITLEKIAVACGLELWEYRDYLLTTVERYMRINKLLDTTEEDVKKVIELIKSVS